VPSREAVHQARGNPDAAQQHDHPAREVLAVPLGAFEQEALEGRSVAPEGGRGIRVPAARAEPGLDGANACRVARVLGRDLARQLGNALVRGILGGLTRK